MSAFKKIILLLIPNLLYASHEQIMVSARCESIHRQKYLNVRLKRAVELLRQISPQTTRTLLHLDPTEYRHPTIIETVAAIQKQQSLDPIVHVWNSFAGFERVDDPLFAREFTELIFAIQRQLIQRSQETDTVETNRIPSMNGVDALLSLEGITFTEAMTTRYYYAKRIEQSVNNLRKIECSRHIFFEKDDTGKFVPTRFHTFEHPEIRRCIEQMNQRNSLAPLMWLSDSFQNMKCLDDELFLKEFLLLHLAVQHNIGTHSTSTKGILKDRTTQEVTNIYRANFNNLPIEKILEGINMLGQELPPLIEQYELNNPDLTWKQWFQKNKWAIPLMIGQAGVNIGWWLFQQKYSQQVGAKKKHHGRSR